MNALILLGLLSLTEPARFLGDEGPNTFKVPKYLAKKFEFWKALYAKYKSTEFLLYDVQNQDVHYGTVDISDLQPVASESRAAARLRRDKKERRVQAAKEKLVPILRKLAARWGKGTAGLSGEERRVARAIAHVKDRRQIAEGATVRRIGGIGGIANRFQAGVERYSAYRPYVVAVLRQHKIPDEIEALTFTESLFSPTALSRSAAYGCWQFLKSTGKLFLQINELVDERRDPIVATHGAARMLAQNLGMLKNWPMALTGYNYGPYGLRRAADEIGSYNLGDILKKYRHKRFAFDGRNYYAGFLAALHTLRNWQRYFPDARLVAPLEFETVALKKAMTLKAAANRIGADVGDVARLNLALNASAMNGLSLPAGFWLRVPKGAAARARAIGTPVSESGTTDGPKKTFVHVVRPKESIYSIAMKYGVPPAVLRELNGVPEGTMLVVRQSIKVPAIDRRRNFTRLAIANLRLVEDRLAAPGEVPDGLANPAPRKGDGAEATPVSPAPDVATPERGGDAPSDDSSTTETATAPVAEPRATAEAHVEPTRAPAESPTPNGMTLWVRGLRALSPSRGRIRALPGESLVMIAKWSDASVKRLRQMNAGMRNGEIEGRVVRVELGTLAPQTFAERRLAFQKNRLASLASKSRISETITHTVIRNDHIDRLVPKRYRSRKDLVATFNPGMDIERLKIGEKLVIPIVAP
ncbi:MAG: transglycosylase SLT domain-containing protein [Deltaproteobacteria bacterium]|nr:transglycosylase SLT domain-containing protein [Deltaproteobacteria bacterium]